jgi:putative redox protein
MATEIIVQLEQVGATASEARIRAHALTIDRPETKGGSDRGPMGGEVLLAALGGCFSSTLFAAIIGRGADVRDVRITVTGSLAETPSRFERIVMQVRATSDDPRGFERLVAVAERGCIVANTLRPAVDLVVETQVDALDGG